MAGKYVQSVKLFTILVAALAAVTGAILVAQEDNTEPSVWDGVYSSDQADRGQKVYEATCARCHGADLTGGRARPLVGESFVRDWGGLTLDSVLTRAKTMPPGAAGSLAEERYLDILAYVLSKNDFPIGTGDLTATTAPDILIYGSDGPDAVPNFAMVQVVGCLATGSDSDWKRTDSNS